MKEGRCGGHPFQRDPWWPYVWSLRTELKVGIDGRVPVGAKRMGISVTPGRTVTRGEHPDGPYPFLAQPPGSGGNPIVLLRDENMPM